MKKEVASGYNVLSIFKYTCTVGPSIMLPPSDNVGIVPQLMLNNFLIICELLSYLWGIYFLSLWKAVHMKMVSSDNTELCYTHTYSMQEAKPIPSSGTNSNYTFFCKDTKTTLIFF
jgi:hypothetical protein